MDTTNFKGNKVNLAGSLPKVGDVAPDFTYVKSDLSEGKLSIEYNRIVLYLIS